MLECMEHALCNQSEIWLCIIWTGPCVFTRPVDHYTIVSDIIKTHLQYLQQLSLSGGGKWQTDDYCRGMWSVSPLSFSLFCMCQHQAHFSSQRVFADNLQNGSHEPELLDLLKCKETNVCSLFSCWPGLSVHSRERYTPKTGCNILFRTIIVQNEGMVLELGGYSWWMITCSSQWLTPTIFTAWNKVQCGDFKSEPLQFVQV